MLELYVWIPERLIMGLSTKGMYVMKHVKPQILEWGSSLEFKVSSNLKERSLDYPVEELKGLSERCEVQVL